MIIRPDNKKSNKKKFVYIKDKHFFDEIEEYDAMYKCPACDMACIYPHYKYCPNCGMKLRWQISDN